ncbi:uncharacterized protein HD556DRAFT_1308727 [Suillus plorans]|uniref:Uncharacterized protein n=1 Tax=Suillus plorans TaxID=116603 RepID=A0A9P7AQF9_9AGAM|nr:uncharacterized protein HD556DRAFT_1308727 [Suillus plorans]KAG1793296.1 hypothetical protein HD556DRAFT_1308727 [Suillus plorans]
MSLDRSITACLCSWGRHSGYVEVLVRDVAGGGFDIAFIERYFGSHADVGKHTVFVSSSEDDSQRVTEFSVFYNRNLHRNGTQGCPYLVLKIAEGGRADNLTRSDYVAVIVAIDEILQAVPPSDTAAQGGQVSTDLYIIICVDLASEYVKLGETMRANSNFARSSVVLKSSDVSDEVCLRECGEKLIFGMSSRASLSAARIQQVAHHALKLHTLQLSLVSISVFTFGRLEETDLIESTEMSKSGRAWEGYIGRRLTAPLVINDVPS